MHIQFYSLKVVYYVMSDVYEVKKVGRQKTMHQLSGQIWERIIVGRQHHCNVLILAHVVRATLRSFVISKFQWYHCTS